MLAEDAVVLRPAWAALLSSCRFAWRTTWTFGNGAGRFQCTEPRSRRRLNERGPLDPLRVRFDIRRWASASARTSGTTREISIVADDGDEITRLRLEEADPALDELIWRLIADDPATSAGAGATVGVDVDVDVERLADELAVAPTLEAFDAVARRSRLPRDRTLTIAGANVARRLMPTALATAAHAALAAGLPLRVRLENSGGRVTWTPSGNALDAVTQRTLRAGRVAVAMVDGAAPVWALELSAVERCCPAIERSAPGDRGWLRLDVASDHPATCATWRRICATLEENP